MAPGRTFGRPGLRDPGYAMPSTSNVGRRTDRERGTAHTSLPGWSMTWSTPGNRLPNALMQSETAVTRTPIRNSTKAASATSAKTALQPERDAKPAAPIMQGEGNYEAARAFNAAERKFVASGKVAAAARAAAPRSEAERQAMLAAEEEGKRRAKK